MAVISTASSLFTSPNFTFNPPSSPHSIPSSINYKRSTTRSAFTTAERTATESGSIRSFRTPTPNSSLYDVLGVRVGADTREIKLAYRKLARLLHPDVASGHSSPDEFMKLHSAYSTLSDPEKRAVYDRSLIQRRAGESFAVRSAACYPSQRWETDQCW